MAPWPQSIMRSAWWLIFDKVILGATLNGSGDLIRKKAQWQSRKIRQRHIISRRS